MSKQNEIIILGIETSCDETAAAVVKNGREIVSNVVASQIESHKRFGGVVPELASRHHVEDISLVIEEAMDKANIHFEDIDAIAVTEGPGLVGALLVGISAAKSYFICQKHSINWCSSYCRTYLCQSFNNGIAISFIVLSCLRWPYGACLYGEAWIICSNW